MTWPLNSDQTRSEIYHWSESYAPEVMAGQVSSIEDIKKKLDQFQSRFPLKNSDYKYTQPETTTLYKIWSFLMIVFIPFIWLVIILRIIQQLVDNQTRTGLELTLVFIIFIGLSFASMGIYALYRRYRDRLDVIEQLQLLSNHLGEKSDLKAELEQLVEERDGKVYWKSYHINWDLSDLFPSLSLVDLIAIFSSIFSLIYVFVWMISSLRLAILNSDTFFSTIPFIVADLILIPTFLYFTWIGSQHGLTSGYYSDWKGPSSQSYLTRHLLSLAVSASLLILVDLLQGSFNVIFVVIILFGHIPLLASFAINRLIYLRNYIRIRHSLVRQLGFQRIKIIQNDFSEQAFLMISDATNRLNSQSLLPMAKLRSYILVLTALLSVTIPILTAFLSSIDRLDDILRFLIP